MNWIFLPIFILLVFAGPSFAVDKKLPKSSNLPVEVTANHLEARRLERQSIFTGDVVVRQGDIILYCDNLTIFSLEKENQIDRMEADGNVRVVQLGRTATADRAIYRQQSGTLLLLGNAQVHQGQNQLAGDEITIYFNEDRSVVKSHDTGRVRAVLFPEQKKDLE